MADDDIVVVVVVAVTTVCAVKAYGERELVCSLC